MNPFSPPAVLTRKSQDRAELSVHPLVRAAQAAAAAAFALGFRAARDPLWLAGTAVCLLAALSEDRWILDARARRVRRRFGILPVPRTFDLGWDEIEAVFVETVEHPAPEDLAARPDDLRSLYPRLVGKAGRGWTAWGFRLSTGEDLTVRAETPAREEAVRDQAGAVADFLGKELRGA